MVSEAVAEALARHYGWDTEKATEEYLNDPSLLESLYGMSLMETPAEPEFNAETLCPSCYESEIEEWSYVAECGHYLCNECFTYYLETKVNAGSSCLKTPCPDQQCRVLVSQALFKQLLEKELYRKYEGFSVSEFVEAQERLLKYCQGPGCESFIEKKTSHAIRDVQCTECETEFCFQCGNEAHTPIDCRLLQQWKDRMNSSDDSTAWIKLNTKNCPKCKTAIEKNQGCMHMTCSKCCYEFCWICLKNYYGHYSCLNEDTESEEYKKNNNSKMQLNYDMKRATHYYELYLEH